MDRFHQPGVARQGRAAGGSGAGLWRDCGGGVKSGHAGTRADSRHRRGRRRDPRIGRFRARARRAYGGRLRRRPARLERVRGGAARSRHPRHRPARHGRPRALSPPALALRGAADCLPHLARGGVRLRARPRDWRRRLPVQAVLDARADGPGQGAVAARVPWPRVDPRRPAAQPGARAAAGRRFCDGDTGGRPRARRRPLRRRLARHGDPADGHRVPAARGAGPPARAREVARPAAPGRVSARHDGERSHHRQPRERLRRKFQDVDAAFDAIESVYGAGYRLRTED